MPKYRHRSASPLASLLAFLCSTGLGAQTAITHYEPSQLRVSSGAQTLIVHGTGLQAVQSCAGVVTTPSGTTVVLPTVSQVTATSLQLAMPAVSEGEILLLLHPCATPTQCIPITGGVVSVLPSPPTVSSVGPAIVTNDVDTPVGLQGSDLDTVTSVYLEGDNGTIRCLSTTPTSPSTVRLVVPRGCTPGVYTVRAIADDSASFYPSWTSPVTLTVAEPNDPPIRVTNASSIFAPNLSQTTIALTGPDLGTITNLQVALDNPSDALPPVAAIVVGTLSNDEVVVTIPAGLPGKLYDFVVTAPGRGNGPSDVKFIVLDNNLVDFLGNFTAVGIDGRTVAFTVATASRNWTAVVENGRLRFLYDFVSARPVIGDSGDTRANLGLGFDAGPWTVVGSGATLSGIAANPSIGGVDFQYATASGTTFSASWGIEQPTGAALTSRFSYTAATATPPVNTIFLPAIGVLPGFRHLAAAQGGLALDANMLAGLERTWVGNKRGLSLAALQGYDSSLCFLEDPQGGGLLVDATALTNTIDHIFHHWPTDAATWTELAMQAQPGISGLVSGSLGPIRYVPTTDNWATAVEPFEAAMSNPHQPTWFSTLSHVTQMLAVNRADIVTAAEIMAPFIAVQDSRVLSLSDWRAVYAHNPMVEGFSLIPQWTPGVPFATEVFNLHNQGFKVVPYVPTPGLGPAFTPQSPFDQHIIQFWDFATGMLQNQYWDANGNGVFDLSTDYHVLSLSSPPYRQQWQNEVQAARAATFPFEGIYFDFLDGNLPLRDRNPNNGNAQVGFTDLCNEFSLQFSGPGNDFLIATEGQNEHLVRSGSSLGAIHVNGIGPVSKDPMQAYEILTNAHPIGSYLLRRHSKAFHAFDVAAPGIRQCGVAMGELAGYVHGALPTATFLSDAFNRPWLSDPAASRALTQSIEEGLFRRLFSVALKTDPDPLWADPTVVAVYSLAGGTTMPLTQAWVVQKTICDLYWWFGGRAPTSLELTDLAGRTSCSAIGLYAAMTEVREQFRGTSVTPLTRSQFRSAVQAGFPLYPQI